MVALQASLAEDSTPPYAGDSTPPAVVFEHLPRLGTLGQHGHAAASLRGQAAQIRELDDSDRPAAEVPAVHAA
jgi:hypothetical protein